MIRRLLCAALLATAACDAAIHDGLPFYRSAELTPEWISDAAAGSRSMHRVSRFALANQHGRIVRDSILDGRLSIVHFFVATCGGVCPVARNHMADLLRTLADSDLVVLSHSVQPERDTVPALAAYAKRHDIRDPRWQLLTGARTDMERLARDSYFVNLSDGRSYGTEQLAHTETVVLVDRERRIRGVYNGILKLDMDRLGDDVVSLRQQAGP